MLWSQLPGEFDWIPSDRTPHELLASSGTGRMHGSTGVQLRICTVDPSGSPVITRVYWCTSRTASAQHKHSALLISLLGSQLPHSHQSPGRVSLSTSESLQWLPLLLVPVSEWVRPKTKSVRAAKISSRFNWGSVVRVVSKRSRTRNHGVLMWTKVKPVVKADRSEKSWKLDQATVKGTTGCLHSNVTRERPFNLFLLVDKNAYSNKNNFTPTIEIYDIILKLISIETKRKLPGTIGC